MYFIVKFAGNVKTFITLACIYRGLSEILRGNQSDHRGSSGRVQLSLLEERRPASLPSRTGRLAKFFDPLLNKVKKKQLRVVDRLSY